LFGPPLPAGRSGGLLDPSPASRSRTVESLGRSSVGLDRLTSPPQRHSYADTRAPSQQGTRMRKQRNARGPQGSYALGTPGRGRDTDFG